MGQACKLTQARNKIIYRKYRNMKKNFSPSLADHSAEIASAISDQDISDAYIYLLGRLLILRQQQLDFKEGFKWNQIMHRKPGAVDWPNPNLDVAYSEAWIAIDENSYTILTVPKITDRYFTVQFLNGWGETLLNINERTFPDHSYGKFAICLKDANVQLPKDLMRIDLPVKHSRVLSRVELGFDREKAAELQHQFSFEANGTPKLPEIPTTPAFNMEMLPGVEAFEVGTIAMSSELDTNEGMEPLQQLVKQIADVIHDPAERSRVDSVIRKKAFADFAKAGVIIGHGTVRNNWVRPSTAGIYGNDYLTRTLVNFGGIWANVFEEVIYYKCAMDNTGKVLHSDHSYQVTFPPEALPENFVKYFWSVIAVDNAHMRILSNPINRFLLNKETRPEYGNDGSLTLYFAAEKPAQAPDGNWLPTPKGQLYRLTFRFYGPKSGVWDGTYYPPALSKI